MGSTSDIALVALAVLGLAPSEAGAQALCVDARHEQGLRMREQGQDREAAEIFRRLWEERHEACARARQGLAEDALQQWVDAESHINEALALDDRWIGAHRRALEAQLATIRAHLASLSIEGPAGAEVWIDRQRVGTLPLERPVRVVAGTVLVEIRARGITLVSRDASVFAGQSRVFTFDGLRIPDAENSTPSPPSPPPSPVVTREATRPLGAPVSQPEQGSGNRGLSWVFGGVSAGLAVVGLGVAIGLQLRREDEGNAYNSDESATGCRSILGSSRSTSEQRQSCAGRQQEIFEAPLPWIIAGYSAAGVFAIASAILFATAPRGSSSRLSSRAVCGLYSSTELGCAVTF